MKQELSLESKASMMGPINRAPMNKLKKFFSSLLVRTRDTFHQYPVSIATIVLAFTLMMFSLWSTDPYGYYGYYYDDYQAYIDRVILILWVILPIFTAVTLFLKRRWWLLAGVAAGLILYFTTADALPEEDMEQLLLWGFSFYSLMFVLPLWRKNQNNGFWNYCAQIFFVLVLGFACSGILAISLALAIESIRSLFMVDIDYRWSETVMYFSFFFVLPLFVHVGLPQDWEDLEKKNDYPQFFAPLSFYLLTPISLLYFVILSVYVLKILVTWQWPSGQVAYPVMYLSMVVFGFYLFSYPWRKTWQRWFFVALLPFMAVYFWALGMRIGQYGLTDLRYLGVLLGMCVTALAVYFGFVKRQRLQMMLIPLAIVAFVVSAGPLSATEIPLRSQESRLEKMLTEIGALQEGRLVAVDPASVDEDTLVNISSTVEYIYSHDRLADLQAWTDVDLTWDADLETYRDIPTEFMQAIGLSYQPWGYYGYVDTSYVDYSTAYLSTFNVSGFDAMAEVDLSYDPNYPMQARELSFDNGTTLTLNVDSAMQLTISDGTNTLNYDLAGFEAGLRESLGGSTTNLDPDTLMIEAENRQMKVRIYFNTINGYFTDSTQEQIQYLNMWGRMLVDFK